MKLSSWRERERKEKERERERVMAVLLIIAWHFKISTVFSEREECQDHPQLALFVPSLFSIWAAEIVTSIQFIHNPLQLCRSMHIQNTSLCVSAHDIVCRECDLLSRLLQTLIVVECVWCKTIVPLEGPKQRWCTNVSVGSGPLKSSSPSNTFTVRASCIATWSPTTSWWTKAVTYDWSTSVWWPLSRRRRSSLMLSVSFCWCTRTCTCCVLFFRNRVWIVHAVWDTSLLHVVARLTVLNWCEGEEMEYFGDRG